MRLGRGLEGGGQRDRLLQRREALVPLLLVQPHPLHHFGVKRLGGGQVQRAFARAHRQPLGKSGLARPRPAQNQNMSVHVVPPTRP